MAGEIIFKEHAEELIKAIPDLSAYSQIGVLTDENTARDCYPPIRNLLPGHAHIVVPSGEEFKNLDTCIVIWQKLTDLAFDRHSLLIILGGGVVGDMGGFCAATFKRGISFILIPTTLLSQVDASVGGKLGIDFNHIKNHIGVFAEPRITLISSMFLKTLPLRELRSGFAEVIKHCLIADKKKWKEISKRPLGDQSWSELVPHSVAIKKSITDADPKENGLRKILNFGHTIGHALESIFLTTGNRIYHGEAIVIGMIMESFIAKQKGLLTADDLGEISQYLLSVYGKISINASIQEIIAIMLQDKKNKGNQIITALPEGIGAARWDEKVSEEEITDAVKYYQLL